VKCGSLAAVLVLAFGPPPPAANAVQTGDRAPVVARVNGPISRILSAGVPLPRGKDYELGPGDEVTLLNAAGVRVIGGPGWLSDTGEFRPKPGGEKRKRRASLAGVRGLSSEASGEPIAESTPEDGAETPDD
jgi:hypothetical protein